MGKWTSFSRVWKESENNGGWRNSLGIWRGAYLSGEELVRVRNIANRNRPMNRDGERYVIELEKKASRWKRMAKLHKRSVFQCSKNHGTLTLVTRFKLHQKWQTRSVSTKTYRSLKKTFYSDLALCLTTSWPKWQITACFTSIKPSSIVPN